MMHTKTWKCNLTLEEVHATLKISSLEAGDHGCYIGTEKREVRKILFN